MASGSIPSNSTDAGPDSVEKPTTPEDRHSDQHIRLGDDTQDDLPGIPLRQTQRRVKTWKSYREGEETRWWFASTAIPLLAATLGPLANVLSLAALVSYWRATIYIDGEMVSEFDGIPFKDPSWCYWLNVASLIAGFLGNIFLLLNFTQRFRYIIALPATIILWYFATGILIGITACMEIYTPPNRPLETYSQGFWYAIAAAVFYLICSMILMINMLGFFMGHYPDTFALTDAQRTLILQTMLFFIWLAGGAGVFARIETDTGLADWEFADALYFCDVTILTVGFGDLYPTTNVSRGIVFPYSVGGIIMLGLVISSIYKFMKQLGQENIIQKHVERMRERTMERTVTTSFDLRQREHEVHHLIRRRESINRKSISGPSEGRKTTTAMGNTVRRVKTIGPHRLKKARPLLLREEKDRFYAMRRIQLSTHKFKKWWALTFSIVAFAILWCVGAIVFWQAENKAQGMSYFQALYFCYISLLTIGYGDMAPKSNAGRCFFVVWSLIAVPTMTILISDLGDTLIAKFKAWSNHIADFTVLPQSGIWRGFLDKHPWLLNWLQMRAAKKRIEHGFDVSDPEAGPQGQKQDQEQLPKLAISPSSQASPTHLPTHLALSIQRVSTDILHDPKKCYTYEDWVTFSHLIRSSFSPQNRNPNSPTSTPNPNTDPNAEVDELSEDDPDLISWDWLGPTSPLTSGVSESAWLLEKLCEALVRIERHKARAQTLSNQQNDDSNDNDNDKIEDGNT